MVHHCEAMRARLTGLKGAVSQSGCLVLCVADIHAGHAQVIAQYGGAEVVWCQEEPKNMGAHAYVKPRLATALRELGEPAGIAPRPLHYVGRTASASVGARTYLSIVGDICRGLVGMTSTKTAS